MYGELTSAGVPGVVTVTVFVALLAARATPELNTIVNVAAGAANEMSVRALVPRA
jgi:hypothetical protein